MIIAVLAVFDIPYAAYNAGGSLINLFLGPATVCLAVTIYAQIDLLKKNLLPILAGCAAGAVTSVLSIWGLCRLFGLDRTLTVSLLPKSVTTPIATAIAEGQGGIVSITVAAVIFTGILGNLCAPALARLFRVKDRVAAGLAIGACSHAMGTAKALELGETEGAMSGLAIGLCGMDGQLFQAEQLDEKYGLVGKITGVNPEPVENALLSGYIPVVSTVAQGVDADTAYNINADTAASKLAAAMGAEKLILLTDVRGLLRNPRDEETLIHVVHTYDVPGLVAQGIISGGMIPKMECCVDAIAGGVERVHILDGRIPHSILIELLSDEGIGTMLKKED